MYISLYIVYVPRAKRLFSYRRTCDTLGGWPTYTWFPTNDYDRLTVVRGGSEKKLPPPIYAMIQTSRYISLHSRTRAVDLFRLSCIFLHTRTSIITSSSLHYCLFLFNFCIYIVFSIYIFISYLDLHFPFHILIYFILLLRNIFISVLFIFNVLFFFQ